jgi:hypothetical protein
MFPTLRETGSMIEGSVFVCPVFLQPLLKARNTPLTRRYVTKNIFSESRPGQR